MLEYADIKKISLNVGLHIDLCIYPRAVTSRLDNCQRTVTTTLGFLMRPIRYHYNAFPTFG